MNISEIADRCTKIISSPEMNLELINDIMNAKENIDTVFLSLSKVFINIIPLYKIRIHSDKIKHKNGELHISQYDRNLVNYYNKYVKLICDSKLSSSFRAACELLRSVDHFNFNDRIISKVLNGTLLNSEVGKMCVSVLSERIKDDINGDSVFIILNECLDYRCNGIILKSLLESKYIHKCVKIRIDKEEKYNKERNESIKLAQKNEKKGIIGKYNNGKKIFQKENIFDKKLRKEIKKRVIKENLVKKEENEIQDELENKNYIKTVNALQRLYFTLLKEKREIDYSDVFIGIRMYIKLIRLEFLEGLYVLLQDKIKECSYKEKLEGIRTIIEIYENYGYDFKNVINIFYELLLPYNFNPTSLNSVNLIIEKLFVKYRQPLNRVFAIMQRLILLRCVRYIDGILQIIKLLEVTYDIDYKDNDMKIKDVIEFNDIDRSDCKPFYEYFLLKKILL